MKVKKIIFIDDDANFLASLGRVFRFLEGINFSPICIEKGVLSFEDINQKIVPLLINLSPADSRVIVDYNLEGVFMSEEEKQWNGPLLISKLIEEGVSPEIFVGKHSQYKGVEIPGLGNIPIWSGKIPEILKEFWG